jgi:hypothetical protein
MSGEPVLRKTIVKAVISKRIVSSLKHKEYLRIKAGVVAEGLSQHLWHAERVFPCHWFDRTGFAS